MITIIGPTASGKSDLGLYIAQKFNGEILCADSKTIYRGLDIGSAKPSLVDRELVPHHLLDIAGPGQPLAVQHFRDLALEAIEDINQRGRLPVMVGGSGLYIDSVLYGFTMAPAPDPDLRRELESLPLPQLLERLQGCDPAALSRIDTRNPRRVIRAIETAGLPRPERSPLRPGTLIIGLAMDKEVIQNRIKVRIEKMLAQGFVDEVEAMGHIYGFESEAMSGIGYRAFRGVIEGSKTVAEAADEFARGDLRLVKKQLTWFRRNPDITWLDGSAPDLTAQADALIERFLEPAPDSPRLAT